MKDTTNPIEAVIVTTLAQFEPDAAKVAELVANAKPVLAIKDPTYDQVREARLELYRARTAIQRKHKELKAPALEFGRSLDAKLRELCDMIVPTEEALQKREAEIKEAAERAEVERLQEVLERFRAVGSQIALWQLQAMSAEDAEAELALATAEHEGRQRAAAEAAEQERIEREARLAEEERVRAEQAAERARLAEELERLKAEQAKERAEREAERAELARLRAEEERAQREREARHLEENRAFAKRLRDAEAAARPVAVPVEAVDPAAGEEVAVIDERPAPPEVQPDECENVQYAHAPLSAPTREELWEALEVANENLLMYEPDCRDEAEIRANDDLVMQARGAIKGALARRESEVRQ